LKKSYDARFEDLKQKNVDSLNNLTQEFMKQLTLNQEEQTKEMDKQAKDHREKLEAVTQEH